jgi:nucleotide-binding universal stress UspA family protein
MKTSKMKKVLIALDYDPTSKKVAEDGFKMAKAMGAEVTLLHVTINSFLYTSVYENMGDWQYDSLDTIALRNAGSRNFLEKAKRHLGDTTIQTVMKGGDFAQKILETAEEIKADCIVMGSHSQKWLENILVGSVTEEVLRKTTFPLFIVPTKKRD